MLIKYLIKSILIYFSIHFVKCHTNEYLENASLIKLHKNGQQYFFNAKVGLQKISMIASFSDHRPWIKNNQCKICKDDHKDCNESCFSNDQSKTFQCTSQVCAIKQTSSQSQMLIQQIIQSRNIEINLKTDLNKDIYKLPLSLVDQMSQYVEYDSQIGVLANQLFQWGLLVKDKDENIVVYNKMIDQQILDAVFTQDSVKIIKGYKRKSLQENDQEKSLVSTFNCKALRSINSKDAGIPPVELNLTTSPETTVQIVLDSSSISFPPEIFKKFFFSLQEAYFKKNQCKFLSKVIKCVENFDMGQLFNSKIQFQLQSNVLSLPLRSLFSGCKQNQCKILIEKSTSSQNQNIIRLGTAILNTFAIQYQTQQRYVIFHRLDNQWNELYQNSKIDTNKQGFIWTMALIIFHVFYYLFKIIFYLAIISILINCVYHRHEIVRWLKNINKKIGDRRKMKNTKQAIPQTQGRQIDGFMSQPKNRLPLYFKEDGQEEEDEEQSSI